MGSWELYQGILNGLDDCIVMSIGIKGLDGLSFKIKDIFDISNHLGIKLI